MNCGVIHLLLKRYPRTVEETSIKTVDVFECTRGEPNVPIETSVKDGKIGSIGLSEVGTNTIRKARAVHFITGFEIELSLFTPDLLTTILQTRAVSNFKLVEAVGQIAKRNGMTMAQVAIGWQCHPGAVSVPGPTRVERVIKKCKAASLSDEDTAEIQKILNTLPIFGERSGGPHEKSLNAQFIGLSPGP